MSIHTHIRSIQLKHSVLVVLLCSLIILETPAYTLAELSHKWQSTICALMDGVAQYTLAEPCFF